MSYGNGLLGCFSDCGICIYGLFCGCCLHAQNHAKVRNESCTICHVINPTSEFWIRKALHEKNGESTSNDCSDCIVGWLCFECAICQDARALK